MYDYYNIYMISDARDAIYDFYADNPGTATYRLGSHACNTPIDFVHFIIM